MKVAVITGTRPNFTDMAPILRILENRCILLHYNTGQHYDSEMSKIFFDQLQIPKPTCEWDIGRQETTHAGQTARMLVLIERQLAIDKPDVVVVKGDTNSALAGALASAKLHIPVHHVEAGCRAFDNSLPEELNRKVIAQLTDVHYTPTKDCSDNLVREGISASTIFQYGHPVTDSIKLVENLIDPRTLPTWHSRAFFMTLHRDFNVDDRDRLQHILRSIDKLDRVIVFSMHPRTRKRVSEFGLETYLERIHVISPTDYITSLTWQKHCYGVITDSGGIQKESIIFGRPIILLRPNSEWSFSQRNDVSQPAFAKGSSMESCVQNLDHNYEKIVEAAHKLSSEFTHGYSSPSSLIANRILRQKV